MVAVLLYENENNNIFINENDLEISTTRGSGKGGQHRNKTETAVIIKHTKYNITVRCESERSQFQNKQIAIDLLKAKINNIEKQKLNQQFENNRKNQIGNLNRGSDKKIKIYKEKLNLVFDLRNNNKLSLSEWLKGNF